MDYSSEPRAKIEDVAVAAGVSIMSVSRAMRGVEGLSGETRARIIATADQLGYVPNRAAGSLAAAGSNLIGISVPTLFDAVFAEIVEGMRGPLLRAGFETMIETSDYSQRWEEAWIERILKWSPAAIVVCGTNQNKKSRQKLANSKIPTLEIWDICDDPIDMCVGIDHYAAGYDMGMYLVGLGYRKPSYIGIAAGRDPRAEKRLRGLKDAFGTAGINFISEIRTNKTTSFEAGRSGCTEALLSPTERPDVLCFLTDHLAFGGLMECDAQGIAVPGQIGIVGFNGLSINEVLPRPITTSRTPRALIGSTGAKTLIAAIRNVRTVQTITLPVEIETGATTRHQ